MACNWRNGNNYVLCLNWDSFHQDKIHVLYQTYVNVMKSNRVSCKDEDSRWSLAARSVAWTLCARSNSGVVGSNLTWDMAVFVCLCWHLCTWRPCDGLIPSSRSPAGQDTGEAVTAQLRALGPLRRLVREPTIPTERPPLLGEVSANFWDTGCHVVSVTSLRPYSRISRPEPLLFLPSSYSFVLTRLSGPRSRPTTSQKIW
jgi:hypothetical protein